MRIRHFLHRVERHTILNKAWRDRHRIDGYVRLRDDGFIVLPPEFVSSLMESFNTLSGYYKLEWEPPGDTINFLDITLSKGERWRKTSLLDYTIFEKPASLWLPLTVTSMHPRSVHRCWPVAMVRRLQKRCHSKSDADIAELKFVTRLGNRTSPEYASSIVVSRARRPTP